MATMFSPSWQRYFGLAPAASPPFRRVPLVAAGAPPSRPAPLLGPKPLPPEPPRRAKELAWLTWQLPSTMRAEVVIHLQETLDWRAQFCGPLDAPKEPAGRAHFGLLGEALSPEAADAVQKKAEQELREIIRTLEESQPVLVRNWPLAMHSICLGQLCHELELRGLNTLETMRSGLGRL